MTPDSNTLTENNRFHGIRCDSFFGVRATHPFVWHHPSPASRPPAQMLSRCQTRGLYRIYRALTTAGNNNASTQKNYFRILGVPQRFDVDTDDLATRFKTLQREWHPDRHASGSTGTDPAKAADMSSLINEAYNALRTPHTRANHLLAIFGEDDDPEMEPEFLAWVVEYREKIADAESDSEQISQLKDEVKQFCDDCLRSLGDTFANHQLEDAAVHSAKLKYLWRMSETLDEMSE